jgi:hypothetical protein
MMNARNELLGVYQQWRQLSETEGEAIQASDWRRVDACQSAKQSLQPLIIKFTGEAQEDWVRAGIDKSVMEREIRAVVDDLIRLEHRNGEWVCRQQTAARSQECELEKSTRNLSRVQRSYSPAPSAVWQSYS